MTAEPRCDAVQVRLSAQLDGADVDRGALDAQALAAHLGRCADCRAFEAVSRAVRQQLRFEPVDVVPDVVPAVRRRVEHERDTRGQARGAARRTGRRRPRILAAAAALVVGALVGALLVADLGTEPGPEAAASVPREVVAAQFALHGVDAELELVERGWHPQVPERRWTGQLTWRAPESLSLELRDRTPYPSADWVADDVDLVVDGDRRIARGPRDCPVPGQPTCTPAEPETQVTTGREPFADGAPVPLDLVLPVTSFAGAEEPVLLGTRAVAGREAIGLEVTVAQVQPVLEGLRPAGNLREVHPSDPVALWLDAETMAPLALTVRAGDAPGRSTWAANRGYADEPGDELLQLVVHAVRYGEAAPSADVEATGPGVIARDAGFRDGPVPTWLTGARVPDGFALHRTGTTTGTGPAVDVASWSDGRAWIKVRSTGAWPGGRLFGDLGPVVRTVDLEDGSTAYVNDRGDRVALHAPDLDVVVSGSVGEAVLLDVAASLGLDGMPMPDDWEQAATADRTTAVAALPGLLLPDRLPGFGPPALRVDERTVTAQFAGAGARSFTLVATPGDRLSPPLDASVIGIEVRGGEGRWSEARRELEWVEDGLVLSLRSPTLGLDDLLAVADSLEPA